MLGCLSSLTKRRAKSQRSLGNNPCIRITYEVFILCVDNLFLGLNCRKQHQQQMERGEFTGCGSPTGLESSDPYDLQLGK